MKYRAVKAHATERERAYSASSEGADDTNCAKWQVKFESQKKREREREKEKKSWC